MLINGQRVPTVGKISMNTVMVDVTDVKGGVKPGDEVVLFGKQGAQKSRKLSLKTSTAPSSLTFTPFGAIPTRVS
ncbi:Alanine racemase [compost metagenome]